MSLRKKEAEFDEYVKQWVKDHKEDRIKYWGQDWSDNKYWTSIDKETYCFEPITDGSIIAEEYESDENKNRILFVAKEPHDPGGDINTYRKNTGFQYSPRFWGPAQRVSYGIFYNKDNYSETIINEYKDLQRTAFINIQKCRARSSTNMAYLKDWYLNYGCKQLFEKQLDILKPKIIICLNTCETIWESIEEVYHIKQHEYESRFYNVFATKQQLNEEAITAAYFTKNILCIDCFHLSMPCLNTDVWGQGILAAFSEWKKATLQ